ncbi:PWP1 [Scenedesmus sp. PABB004]|nr:PWP1 [Scenedesmus sp. PABB004]
MISAICWLPRGAAAPVPVPAPLTEEELAAMKEAAAQAAAGVLEGSDDDGGDGEPSDSSSGWETDDDGAGGEGMDVDAAVARARAAAAAIASSSGRREPRGGGANGAAKAAGGLEAALAELDMEHYDDSDDEALGGLDPDGPAAAAVVARALGGRSAGVVLDDPYMDRGGGDSSDEGGGSDDMDSEERDDYTLRGSDLLLLAARSEDDVSTIEVWVYEEAGDSTGGEANIYVHHDIMLPALPLCLAWMDVRPGGAAGRANVVAVGSMDPGIELWDLDVADAVEPAATLGGPARGGGAGGGGAGAADGGGGGGKGAKKKAKAKAKAKAAAAAAALAPDSHEGAVLGLAWNAEFRNVLASGGADGTVKVWDVAATACEHTLRHHSDKVQAVAWNPAEAPVLLSGSFDRTACLADVRTPAGAALSWRVSSDVEALAWNPGSPTCFLVSGEDGLVAAFDARGGAGSKPLFRLAAHNKPACALSFCPGAPGLLATASTDKAAKLWDVSDGAPKLLASKEPKLGALFAAGFCPEVPHLLAMAGAKGAVGVWDVRAVGEVARRYPGLLADVVQPPVHGSEPVRRAPGPRVCRAGGRDGGPRADNGSPSADSALHAATRRLQQLLDDAALSNKDTVPIDFLDACTPEERLTLFTNLGTLGSMLALLVCLTMGDYDPLRLSGATLDAALAGAAAATPLVACSVVARSRAARRAFPVLEEFHDIQHDMLRHVTAGMNGVQRGILICFTVAPALLLLLPAGSAVLSWAGLFLQTALFTPPPFSGALHLKPAHVGPLVAVVLPLVSGYAAGMAAASCFAVRPNQVAAVRDAVRNADGFFRLTRAATPATPRRPPRRRPPPGAAAGPPAVFASTSALAGGALGARDGDDDGGHASERGGGGGDGAEAAAAFRTVALVWLLTRRRVARLCYVLTCLDVAYLAVIMTATGSLATPAAAALLHAAAECGLGEWRGRRGQ